MTIRPGSTIGQLISASAEADNPAVLLYGTVTSVGASTADVLLDGGSRPVTATISGGAPSVGQRVPVQVTPDGYIVNVAGAGGTGRAGLVVVNVNNVSGSTGTPTYPLPHASTHASAGTDAVTPAAIGASTAADIADAINDHTAAGDPHTGYLLADGSRAVAGTLNTRSLLPSSANAYDLGSASYPYRSGYISELNAFVQKINTRSAIQGALYVPKNAGTFPYNVAAGDTTADFGTTMTANDFVVLQDGTNLEYMQVGSLVSGTTYNVTRNLDGSGANAWVAGSVWIDYGYDGDGFIVVDATGGTPTITIYSAGATYSASTALVTLGSDGMTISQGTGAGNSVTWKNGTTDVGWLYGYVSDTYGSLVIGARDQGAAGYGNVLIQAFDYTSGTKWTQLAVNPSSGVTVSALSGSSAFKAGSVNVGSATGAGTGEVKASGDVFASGKGKGTQAQISDVNIYTGTGAVSLTTSYQDVTGVTTGAFTPAVDEYALVNVIGYANLGAGTAQCNLGDRIRFALNVDTVNDSGTVQLRALVSSATQTNQSGGRWWKISLAAGVAHTLKVQATNVDGNRGQAETTTQMMVWRIAA